MDLLILRIRASGLYICAISAFLLAFFIWSKDWKSKVNLHVGFIAFFSAVFSLACGNVYFFWNNNSPTFIDIINYRSTYLGVFILPSFVLFTYYITNIRINFFKFFILYTGAFFVGLGSLLTPYFLSDARLFYPHIVGIAGKWDIVGRIYMLVCLFIALYHLIREYIKSEGVRKNKLKYFVIGSSLYGVTGAIFTSILPYLTGKSAYYDFAAYFSLVWVSLTIYSVVRYKLFEIDTVIHRTIMWLITSCSVLVPIGILLLFIRHWISTLSWIQLTFLMTGLFYAYLFYYRKTQPKIDRLFRRRKYDYYKVLSEVGQKIGSELDINNVVTRIFKELQDILYIRNGMVLVQEPGQLNYTQVGAIGYENIADPQKREKTALDYLSFLAQWLNNKKEILEKEQIDIDPQYVSIRQEALAFLNSNSLELLIPVVMENNVNALVGIGKKENLQAYTLKDIELLENMGRQIGITIDNAMHHEDIVEKERLAEEMKLGREIQMALLPRELPIIRGLSVQGLMQPAKEIGGDYYDFITFPNKDRLAIVIGDVSGKGVAAGLLMAMAKTAIHTLSQDEISPKQILLRTNTILNQHIGGKKFMTMLYLRYDSTNKTLTYSSAGHEHILIYRANQNKVESIISGGFMLGMIPDISSFLEDKNITLNPGDKIILYTDGVTEARNPNEDLFGLENLIESIQKHGSKPVDELLSSIKDEVYAYISTREQYDDITLVVMEVD